MTITEFIGYFKMAKDKKVECEKRVNNKYVPFIQKITDCINIVKSTMEYKKDINDVGVFMQNTPARYLIFNMTLIKKYTDVEVTDQIYDDYDKLNECGALDVLVSCIPIYEFKEYNTLLSMCTDDYIANNRELVSYFENKMNNLTELLDEYKKTEDNVNG